MLILHPGEDGELSLSNIDSDNYHSELGQAEKLGEGSPALIQICVGGISQFPAKFSACRIY